MVMAVLSYLNSSAWGSAKGFALPTEMDGAYLAMGQENPNSLE